MTKFTAKIRSIEKYGDYEGKAKKAVDLFVEVFNSEEFQKRVLEHMWKGKKQFADNEGLSNAQVLEKLLSGSELASQGIDNNADFSLRAYSKLWAFGSAIGHADADKGEIITKWRFIKRCSEVELAGHYAHEYCHLLGFGHDFDVTNQRDFSVPYAIGYIVEELL